MADVDQRLRTVQSWWLGSELVRRHPELLLIETHPGGGQYDCLTLMSMDPGGAGTNLVDLNRTGRIHVGDQTGFMTWEQERAFGDRHGAMRRIENAAGLHAPTQTPSSTGKVLTYRVLASVLTTTLNEREPWDARNLMLDASNADVEPRFDLAAFPSAVEGVRERRRDDLFGRPEYRFWGLIQGEKLVAVLDTDGNVHLGSGPRNLSTVYAQRGRRLNAAIATTLAEVLP
ncbi:hypothetical protein [uncultured Ornithinimicrobium sp.]|uniref:TY-Chap2 family putative peptide chaperone n=1 Tax=uncultured Ornithinimicrobium sp. TaxID=259307 RepID=UPI0025950CDF|nr:hypothetical protein [uncultured Ornithinimicrobium sp.]